MKLLLSLALLAGLYALPASAQQYDVATSAALVVASGGTSNVNAVITCTKYEDVTVQVTLSGTTAATTNGNITVSFAHGVDGTLYETTAQTTVVVAANGATAVSKVANITVGATGYLKLTTIANASSGDGTVTVKVAKKPQREGK